MTRTAADILREKDQTRSNGRHHPPVEQFPEEMRGDANDAYYESQQECEPEPPPVSPGQPPSGPQFKFMTSADFAVAQFHMEWLIKGIMVRGQPAVFGGPKKSLKTSLLVDFALSLGTGSPFLGTFPAPARLRVAMLSGESGERTLQETAKRVAFEKGIELADASVLWGFNLPQLAKTDDLVALKMALQEAKADVLILDPLYLALLSGVERGGPQASNLFQMGPLFSRISETCLGIGCTPVLAHHFRLSRDHDAEPQLEDLAFAGIQEFARQWVLTGRREKYQPGTGQHRLWLSVGGSSGHSGLWSLDIDEGVIDEHFQGRQWDVRIATASEARRVESDMANSARKQERARKDHEDDGAILAALDRLVALGMAPSVNAVKVESGLPKDRAERSKCRLFDAKILEIVDVVIPTGTNGKTRRTVDGLRRKEAN